MKNGTLSVALAACLVAFSAGAARAETTADAPADHEIRVVNRNATTVRVYVQDAKGCIRLLGMVAPSDFKVMKVPEAVSDKGQMRIEVYPVAPVGALTHATDGVATQRMELNGKDAVNVYLEFNLLRSVVEIVKG